MTQHIVSFSGGKDSTAMVHLLLEQGVPVTKLLYFETGWDYPQMAEHLDLVSGKTGVPLVRIRHYRHFEELLGLYGWAKSAGGWCTAAKRDNCLKYVKGIQGDKVEYIGFSADERQRAEAIQRKWPVKFPLIDANMGELDAFNYCQRLGYDWSGLYHHFDRVSCFCCPKAGRRQRRMINLYYPDLWREWERLDAIAGIP